MPNKNGTQTISNENQVAVVDHNASPLQSESKPAQEFDVEGFLKPGLSVEPKVKVR
jgi:hypothetical protein